MTGIIRLLTTHYLRLRTWCRREHTRQMLLGKDEHLLSDVGVSLALLRQGVRGWPWREGDKQVLRAGTAWSEAHAIGELEAYSDAELADLDIHRAAIRDAVKHGRPGYDGGERDAA